MKVTAVIPARYNSSRFKGKPLADICGRPMIWRVYNQVVKSEKIDDVYVATDSMEIMETCEKYKIRCILTSKSHRTSTERLYEVANSIKSDVYVCVNGDEPLIEPDTINYVIPKSLKDFFVTNLMMKIKSPAETVDETNIKVVFDTEGYVLFMSRSPIPHPKANINFDYYKHIGVISYSFDALKFFANTKRGRNEDIEDINELRFIENGKRVKMIEITAKTLSVDTPKDLDYVRMVIKEKLLKGEIKE